MCVCVCVCVGRGRGGGGGGVGGKGETRVFFPLYDSQLEFMNLHRNVVHKHVYTYIYIYTDSNNDHLRVAVHRKY